MPNSSSDSHPSDTHSAFSTPPPPSSSPTPSHEHARKIQHGLSSHSSRHSNTPFDCYIGLAFRTLKTEKEVKEYKDSSRGASESKVDFKKGEELLVWSAVVSDGV